DMILTVDSDEKISYISPNCEKICGFKPEDLTHKNIFEFFMAKKNESDEDKNPFSSAFKSDKIEYRTFKIKHSDGFLHWYGVTISKTSDVNGKDILICNTRNIDQSIEKEKKLVHLSLYDHLTGIPNRAFFDAMLERSQVSRHRPLSLLMCDLDYLKTINDTYGHAKGDEVLQKTAQLLQSSLRKEDFIARIGGDEFAVILPGADNKEALVVIERISETFNDYNSDKSGLAINISIGFSTVKDTETSLEDALCKADMKMYSRKQVNKSLAEL
ncbi:MAG: GGDEF domain-containing protein, partial [Synergistaceae bacterium]